MCDRAHDDDGSSDSLPQCFFTMTAQHAVHKVEHSDHRSLLANHKKLSRRQVEQLSLMSALLLACMCLMYISLDALQAFVQSPQPSPCCPCLASPTLPQVQRTNCTVYSRRSDECAMPAADVAAVRHMDVAVVACGRRLLDEVLVCLKSWLLQRHSSLSLHFHIVLERDDTSLTEQREYLAAIIALWPAAFMPQTEVHFSYYDAAALPSQLLPLLSVFRRCSAVRLFLHHLLPPSLDAVLYVDADTLAVADTRRVWAEFQTHSASQFLGLAWAGHNASWYTTQVRDSFPWPRPWGVNSGVPAAQPDQAAPPPRATQRLHRDVGRAHTGRVRPVAASLPTRRAGRVERCDGRRSADALLAADPCHLQLAGRADRRAAGLRQRPDHCARQPRRLPRGQTAHPAREESHEPVPGAVSLVQGLLGLASNVSEAQHSFISR